MSLTELYTKNTKVWLRDTQGGEVWRSASLLEDYKEGAKQLKVFCERDNEEIVVALKSSADLPHLRNPDILIGENDLTALSYLHEPAVLHNLQVRFCDRNYIYTYCGIVLVAINPYQQLDIYDNDTIRAYSGQDMANMDPHIFAVAEEAFKRMSRFEENQSLIVSGESGAGKTVSAKYAMRYFATVCGAESETSVEKRVLASNPIMEAIGNAKTTRNDNSSRFGKYIQIEFSKKEQITGANMRTYLLEKSRVVFQGAEERNYHIFYQLCSACELDEFKQFHLAHADEFFYTNQGQAPVVSTIDDAEDFVHTRQALTVLGINPVQQMNIFRILSGILHLGNVEFKQEEKSGETFCNILVRAGDRSLPLMSKLLGIDTEQIRYWLCNKKIITAQEVLTVPLSYAQVCFARDALSKHIYSQLFLWIVAELNKSLSSKVKSAHFIGVLDIYGFETFEYNSFEQFCINYANEKLQQQFCRHVFKLEQEEYVREEIEWSFIDFYDNQPCIDLIENKLGILDLLDEECKMPNGSDENWCQKLFTKHGKDKHFEKPRMSRVSFIINHFADKVEYQIEGFIEKNRDTLLEEHINILKASEYELLADLFAEKAAPAGNEPGKPGAGGRPNPRGGAVTVRSSGKFDSTKSSQSLKQHKKTVGSQFHDSLNLLMETLCATTPHYVRCIKPNDSKTPFLFDSERAVQQLRACGVLETVRISAAGYPSRWMYADFFKRYRVLAVSKDIVKNQIRKTCENILGKLITDKDKYQFGKTKIFFRAGQVAYLEKLRSEKLRRCSVIIQKTVRGWLAKKRYAKIRKMATLVQKYARGMLARRHALFLRQTRAATRIRAAWLGYRQRKKYRRALRVIVYIQSYARGLIGRQKFISQRMERKVVLIQRCIRGWEARRKFKKVMRGIVLMQSHVRRRRARKELKQLKIEARSVEKMKNVAKGLEFKIIELQMKLDERSKEVGVLKEEQQQAVELKSEVSRLRTAEMSSKQSADRIQELERLLPQVTEELQEEKRDKEKLVIEKENICREKDEIIGDLKEDKLDLKKQLDSANDELLKRNSDVDGLLKQKIDDTNAALKAEFESERVHHQKLVREYTRLQQRLENLQQDLHLKGGSLLSRSPSNVSNFSVDSGESERTDTDPGYGTTRRKARERESLAASFFDKQQPGNESSETSNTVVPVIEPKDIPLMTKIQNKIRELEKDKARLRLELDRRDKSSDICNGSHTDDLGELEILDAYRIQELETENARVKHDLQQLQKAVAEGAVSFDMKGVKTKVAANQLLEQLSALKDDLKMRQTDCVRLRTLLAQALARSSGSAAAADVNLINEDGELEMAYRTQKELNALLEKELQRLQKVSEMREVDLNKQLSESKSELEKHIKLNGQALSSSPDVRLEATVQLEISRLLSENLMLKEKNDKMHETIKNLRMALKIYSKRLKSTDVTEANSELEREMAAYADGLPAVKHHNRENQGMLEYRTEDEQLLIKNLILDLKPHAMLNHLPGLPAHILFMCMRYTDHINNDEKVRSLLTGAINAIKKVVKKRQDDPETITAWLANTCQLLNNLKQYSGEKQFQTDNTTRQNEQCLRNFDLGEYRQILNDLAVWIYQIFIKLAETQITPMIVSAVLDNEGISGLNTGKQTGIRRDLSKQGDDDDDSAPTPASLTKALDSIMQVLVVHAMDMEVVAQLFKQLFYLICANALNNLLLRKNMCHWMKGMQIRYNLSQLEQWLRDNRLQDSGVEEMLEPIIQATQLLQARKSDDDVDSVCEMCKNLNVLQVVKILNLYTPLNEFEERVPSSFIRQIQSKLSATKSSSQSLLMDTKFVFAVSFPYRASNVSLETLAPPSEWGLGFLQKI